MATIISSMSAAIRGVNIKTRFSFKNPMDEKPQPPNYKETPPPSQNLPQPGGRIFNINIGSVISSITNTVQSIASQVAPHSNLMSSAPIPIISQSKTVFEHNIDDIRVKADNIICELEITFNPDLKAIAMSHVIKCVNSNASGLELISSRKNGNCVVVELVNHYLQTDVIVGLHFEIPVAQVPGFDISINRGKVVFQGPGTLSTFDLLMNVGSCTINEMNASKFAVKNNMGNCDLLNCNIQSLNVKCDAGDVGLTTSHVKDLTIVTHASSQRVLGCVVENNLVLRSDLGMITTDCKCTSACNVNIKNNAGSISAKLIEYHSLEARTDLGQISMELFPSSDSSNKITSEAGAANVKMTNFHGSFDCKSSIGPVTIQGPILIGTQSRGIIGGQKTGSVGKGNGMLNVKTSVGSVSVSFL